MTKLLCASFVVLIAAAMLSCTTKKDEVYCQAFWYIDYVYDEDSMPQSTYGELHCNGQCPDGKECKTFSEEQEEGNISKREWCGCEGDPEPSYCHAVRETYRNGIVRVNCHGDCPVDSDFCRESHREIEAPEGVDKRYIGQCECEARGS